MDIDEKVVLITGGRRIGSSVAEALAQHGAHVGLSYRHSETEATNTVEVVRGLGRRACAMQADLSDADACRRLVETTITELGQLHVLINMASDYDETPVDDLTASDFDRAMASDVRSAYLCSLAAVPHLRRAGGGRIINFSDWVAGSGRPRYRGYLPYYVAKAAVIGLTEALALELAPDAILVNAVAPGPIRPPAGMGDAEIQRVTQATPLGRWGGDSEIVKTVVSLIESDYMTGETLRVDGGRHLR